ncbi:Mitochondrial import receptor subunit TOM40-1 [Spatholobus suberectus]|nr:Mitochondrial import receptor subunit TOM40-1 [Spatholobus suberectus]
MTTIIPPTSVFDKVDYFNLPCLILFEQLHYEAMMSLKPDLFRDMHFDFTKVLNQKFSNHKLFTGPIRIPSQSTETIKIPTSDYKFSSTFMDDPKLLL